MAAAELDTYSEVKEFGQRPLLLVRQVLVTCDLGRAVGERLPGQALAADLPRDPDGGSAYPVPVDAVVVAAVPDLAAGNHLAGQEPPPCHLSCSG